MPVTNLPYIQKQMTRYGMTVYFAFGLLGNILNCIMFTHYSYRRTASSIYFLALSIFAIIYLLWAIIPTIYNLDHTDPQTQSLFYCKVKLYTGHVLGQYVRYVVVFACVDRFFVTRTNIRIRSLNSVSMAIKLVCIMCPTCFIIAIHAPIFINISNGVCGMFGWYKLFYAIYQITLVGILPPVLMCIFSALTVHSLHQRHATQKRTKQKDRYLLRMVIAEVGVNIFTSIPYSANLVYNAATYHIVDKSMQRLEIEAFITYLASFIIYLISVAPFYVFLLTSKPFRQEFIKLLVNCFDMFARRQRRVRIGPFTYQNNTILVHAQGLHGKT